ncbi:hypothetical protein [Falsiroseomonas bella]|nr:hypothetical protein [Falsiroseomonas bella]
MRPQERAEFIRATGRRAEQEYQALVARLDETLSGFEPFHVLSLVGLVVVVGAMSGSQGIKGIGQAHAELLQALILRRDPASFTGVIGTPQQVAEALDLIGPLADALMMRGWANYEYTGDERAQARAVTETMRMHTWAIRGEFYGEQILRIFLPIVRPLDPHFRSLHGLRASAVYPLLRALARQCADRLEAHLARVRRFLFQPSFEAMAEAYNRAFPHTEPIDVGWARERFGENLAAFKFGLVSHSDLFVADAVSISLDDVAAAAAQAGADVTVEAAVALVDKLAMSLGDLADVPVDRLFLANPVWSRPFVRAEGRWLLPMASTLTSFAPEIIRYLSQDDSDASKALAEARASMLEQTAADILRVALPGAGVWPGVAWTDPSDARRYENDVVLLLDGWLLLVEAKSGRFAESARRGGLERLRAELGKLVVDASIQSARLAAFIGDAAGPVTLQAKGGRRLHVDPARIEGVIRLNVVLEGIGHLTASAPTLRAAGLLPADISLAPTMTIGMLDVVARCLADPTAILHYLSRRAIFEERGDYLADELDLLAFYVAHGFSDTSDRPPGAPLMIYGISNDLDVALSAGTRAASEQPKAVTPFVQRVLDALTRKRPPGWIGAALLLRDLSLEAQDELDRNVRAVVASARTSGHAVAVHRHSTIGASRPYVLVATRPGDVPRAVADEAEARLREHGPYSDEPLLLVHVTLPMRPASIRAFAARPGNLAGALGRSD